MLTASTPGLDLFEVYIDSDPNGRVSPAFPINCFTGAEHTAVVYFEVQPGDYLPTHTDSAEEVLYIVAGECEAHAGDEVRRLQAGDLAVVPAMVPHGISKVVGDETLKVVGFFAGSTIVSTFDEPLAPVGERILEQAPVPV